jgi:demethylmenaquinone methyltransferase/2-methoxy-6-polyprenyl-1,4-benzoquinol methylase
MSELKSEFVKPYQVEADKKNQVSSMFNNISGSYDFLNHFLSLGIDKNWRKKAAARLKLIQNESVVLDVATGTSDLALEIYKQHQPAKIYGVDIAVKMLEIGRKKIEKKNWSEKIVLSEADSENLPFEDNFFDAISVSFGVRNFAHVKKGILEMQRVLKPGAQLLILEFSKPRVFPIKQLYNFYFSRILPFIGKITSKDQKAYQYLYESVQAFPEGKEFEKLLSECGFSQVKSINLTLGICSIYTGIKS